MLRAANATARRDGAPLLQRRKHSGQTRSSDAKRRTGPMRHAPVPYLHKRIVERELGHEEESKLSD
jgi:hypothetical protein